MNTEQLIEQAKQLPTDDKWRLVKELLNVLEHASASEPTDKMGYPIGYFEDTYGSLRDNPVKRWDQGEYEEREPFE